MKHDQPPVIHIQLYFERRGSFCSDGGGSVCSDFKGSICSIIPPEEIVKAFQPYYTSTELAEETDPDKLYHLQHEIESFNLFTDEQVDEFCKEFYSPTDTDERLHPIIDRVVEEWRMLPEEHQQEFKSKIQSFCRLYAYISQIIVFEEVQWEKLFVFLKFLNKKLPKEGTSRIDLSDSVDLDSLRIQMMGESKLSLEDSKGQVYPIDGGEGGSVLEEPPTELLSEIIKRINEVHGVQLTAEDRLDLKHVQNRLSQHNELDLVMKGNNSPSDKKDFFNKVLKDEVSEYYGDRLEFYKKIMDTKVFPMILEGLWREFQRVN